MSPCDDFYEPSERDVALEMARDEWRALVAGEDGLAFHDEPSRPDQLTCGCFEGEGCPRCAPYEAA